MVGPFLIFFLLSNNLAQWTECAAIEDETTDVDTNNSTDQISSIKPSENETLTSIDTSMKNETESKTPGDIDVYFGLESTPVIIKFLGGDGRTYWYFARKGLDEFLGTQKEQSQTFLGASNFMELDFQNQKRFPPYYTPYSYLSTQPCYNNNPYEEFRKKNRPQWSTPSLISDIVNNHPFNTYDNYNYMNSLFMDQMYRTIYDVLYNYLVNYQPNSKFSGSNFYPEYDINYNSPDIQHVIAIIADVVRNFQRNPLSSSSSSFGRFNPYQSSSFGSFNPYQSSSFGSFNPYQLLNSFYQFGINPQHPYYRWINSIPEYSRLIKELNDFIIDEYPKYKLDQLYNGRDNWMRTSGWIFPEDLQLHPEFMVPSFGPDKIFDEYPTYTRHQLYGNQDNWVKSGWIYPVVIKQAGRMATIPMDEFIYNSLRYYPQVNAYPFSSHFLLPPEISLQSPAAPYLSPPPSQVTDYSCEQSGSFHGHQRNHLPSHRFLYTADHVATQTLGDIIDDYTLRKRFHYDDLDIEDFFLKNRRTCSPFNRVELKRFEQSPKEGQKGEEIEPQISKVEPPAPVMNIDSVPLKPLFGKVFKTLESK